jgi:hypothetical protein
MSATLLYRISSVFFFFFAVSHTFGALSKKLPSAEVAAVRSGMDGVHWRFMRAEITYGGMYIGFGLFLTASLLMAALFALHLGTLARASPQAIGTMGWVLFAFSLASLILGWLYFFAGPIIISALIALCLGWAAFQVNTAKR